MSNALQAFKGNLDKMQGQFKMALPEHISPEKFARTALTAVQQNPKLLDCDSKSLFSSLVKCASDGLLPDGREAALVIYGQSAQYMPMVYGVRKRMHNSGEVSSIDAQVVYENDDFDYQLGDEPKIIHKPALENRGKMRLAYCVVRFKDGGILREIMTKDEIYKARECSKAKNNGPWKDWESEMWRKTVLHRAAKAVPTSSDLERFLRADMSRMLGEDEKDVTPQNQIAAQISEDDASDLILHVEPEYTAQPTEPQA